MGLFSSHEFVQLFAQQLLTTNETKSFLLLVEHRFPVYPGRHVHLNPPLNERWQVPPFRQGLDEHESVPNKQCKMKRIKYWILTKHDNKSKTFFVQTSIFTTLSIVASDTRTGVSRASPITGTTITTRRWVTWVWTSRCGRVWKLLILIYKL